ncbi:MAG TPA: tyramine oxidase, partial [Mycobacterium sp.]
MPSTVIRTSHPLDPLAGNEFRQATAILRRDQNVDDRWRFASIELGEPSKAEVANFDDAGAIPDRRAIVVCFNRDTNRTYKALVSLSDDKTLSWTHLPGVQANLTVDEWHEAGDALVRHPEVVAALRRRGVTENDKLLIDVWAYGDLMVPEAHRGRRLAWSDTWVKSPGGANPYANHLR